VLEGFEGCGSILEVLGVLRGRDVGCDQHQFLHELRGRCRGKKLKVLKDAGRTERERERWGRGEGR
jgi:hypothetical protein